jgi:hypothetical protein
MQRIARELMLRGIPYRPFPRAPRDDASRGAGPAHVFSPTSSVPRTQQKAPHDAGLRRSGWHRRQAMMLIRVPCPGGSAACGGGGAVR